MSHTTVSQTPVIHFSSLRAVMEEIEKLTREEKECGGDCAYAPVRLASSKWRIAVFDKTMFFLGYL